MSFMGLGAKKICERDAEIVASHPYIAGIKGRDGFRGEMDDILLNLTNVFGEEKGVWRFTWFDEAKTFCFFFKSEAEVNLFLVMYGDLFYRVDTPKKFALLGAQ